jgi:hypothetical protein
VAQQKGKSSAHTAINDHSRELKIFIGKIQIQTRPHASNWDGVTGGTPESMVYGVFKDWDGNAVDLYKLFVVWYHSFDKHIAHCCVWLDSFPKVFLNMFIYCSTTWLDLPQLLIMLLVLARSESRMRQLQQNSAPTGTLS